jgi:fused signal recognition particle receptor
LAAPVAAIAAPPAAPAESIAAAPAPAAPSLLELAAAQRQQRRQEILAAAAAAPPGPVAAVQTASGAPVAAPSQPAASSPPGSPSAPTAARPSSAADQAEPSLGAFDAEFTWSAEVLAAQGRRVEEVSLEEIDWLSRLRRGLEKTRKGFVAQLLDTLGDDPLSADDLDALESTLLRADVGVQATDRVLEALRQRLNQEVVDPAEGLRFLKEQLRGILEEPITASGHSLLAPQKDRLNVWLLVGVNGVGKTTTLGKLANLAVRSGYSCLIAAADTFRAAAVQQVSVWGERSGVPVVSNPSANADPAAVVYDAIGAAKAKGTELVLVDTAGRLQTKHNLMEELSKVRRIVDKLAPEAVVESLLVLDSSQGQNGLRQAMAFASAAGLTGVVLTKLDGSARGGVALAVASEAGLPIRFVGAGETIRDLRPFNSFEFVEALLAG